MSQVVTATFEDGVLKPSQPLALPPHARVRLTVDLLKEDTSTKQLDTLAALENLWWQSTLRTRGECLNREQLHERR